MLRRPLRKLLILLMVIILIDFKTTMISMSLIRVLNIFKKVLTVNPHLSKV